MCVHEPRCNHEASRVDPSLCFGVLESSDSRDPVAEEADVRAERGQPGPVDHAAAMNQVVKHGQFQVPSFKLPDLELETWNSDGTGGTLWARTKTASSA